VAVEEDPRPRAQRGAGLPQLRAGGVQGAS